MRSSAALQQPAPSEISPVDALSSGDQWSKVAEVLAEAVISAKKARELQSQAAKQLDAATYAFDQMMDEIADLVPDLKPVEEPLPVIERIEPVPREKRVAAALAA
jgi:hypothetical protein